MPPESVQPRGRGGAGNGRSPAAEQDDATILGRLAVTVEPVLVDARGAARMTGLSERYWRKLDRRGRIPAALHVGRRRLWGVATLRAWAESGCPARGDVA
jgi:hypothetical protein